VGITKGVNNRSTGSRYELLAQEYLKKQGFIVLEQNYRNASGEIDIIGIDENTLCFVEVKYRSSEHYGAPEEAVTLYKQKKIITVAKYYLVCHKQYFNKSCRFDVVAICDGSIKWIKDAFYAF